MFAGNGEMLIFPSSFFQSLFTESVKGLLREGEWEKEREAEGCRWNVA